MSRDERELHICACGFCSPSMLSDTCQHEVRAEQAGAELEQAREALRKIDADIPSEEHWHRMGDSMWANIGRAAAHIARAALSTLDAKHGPATGPRIILGTGDVIPLSPEQAANVAQTLSAPLDREEG